MKQQEATEQLGGSMRHVKKRLLRIYRREGLAGLVSKRRGKPSNNRLPAEAKQQALWIDPEAVCRLWSDAPVEDAPGRGGAREVDQSA